MLEIEIVNWEKFNGRRDVKNPSWFRLQHNLLDDPIFFGMNANDICVFIYLLTCCSRSSTSRVRIVPEHARTFSRSTFPQFLKSVEKLKQIQVIKVITNADVTDTNADVTDAAATLHYITLQKDSVCGSDAAASPRAASLHKIAEIWNQHKSPVMPEVKSCNGSRLKNCNARWKENPDEFFWIGIVQRVAKSDFCCGKVQQKDQSRTAWVANFDWLVRSGVANRILEGMYDNRNGAGDAVHPLLRS